SFQATKDCDLATRPASPGGMGATAGRGGEKTMTKTSVTKRTTLALLLGAPALAAIKPARAAPTYDKKPAALNPKRPAAPAPAERIAFTAQDQQLAMVAGFPDARFFGDSNVAFLNAVPMKEGPWLALSGGGEDGAFGAGLLAGLAQSGKRPDFALVTGASTG